MGNSASSQAHAKFVERVSSFWLALTDALFSCPVRMRLACLAEWQRSSPLSLLSLIQGNSGNSQLQEIEGGRLHGFGCLRRSPLPKKQ